MIKIERTSVMNFENALRGMRNPMNSWDKSDSYYDENGRYVIGENDLSLAQRLVNAGSDDRKFLRQIFVSVDVTAPLYWWKEYDTYKVGTVANSTSTMHKIHAKPITMEDFSMDDIPLDDCGGIELSFADWFGNVVTDCERLREKFVETKDNKYWRALIQLLPSSYNQMRTCTLNYENLMNMYYARRYHKLDEWRDFCGWIEGLPYFRQMCIEGKKEQAE